MTSSRRSESLDHLTVGRIVGAFGLHGEVKLLPVTDFPERIPKLKRLHLQLADGSQEERAVRGCRVHGGLFLLTLEGCETPDDAQRFRNAEVCVRLEDAAPLPEGRYFLHQVVGVRVVTEDGEELGRVDEIIPTGANDVYRVGDTLIPATRDAVLQLDPLNDLIVTKSRAYLRGESS